MKNVAILYKGVNNLVKTKVLAFLLWRISGDLG